MSDQGAEQIVDQVILDANGKPLKAIRLMLGDIELIIPPATIAQTLLTIQRQAATPDAGSASALKRLERLTGGFMAGVVNVAVSALLTMAHGMFGRFAPGQDAPSLPAGADPVTYTLGYLASLALHAAAQQRWRAVYYERYDETEGEQVVITRFIAADASPDRGTQTRMGAPSGDPGSSGNAAISDAPAPAQRD